MDPSCPLPILEYERVVLAHGSGGKLTRDLLQKVFLPAFDNPILRSMEDQATLQNPGGRLAFTTDSFVVQPLVFPGGDIGRLAACGTINDLAVGGARPLFLSAAFIIEEGMPAALLAKIAESMAAVCREAGVMIVAGDTKVVDHGKGDQLFITTSGIGSFADGVQLSIGNARVGDHILVSGTMGDHGMAVMSVRDGLAFESDIQSDCAPLHGLCRELLEQCPSLRLMRDPTRGGLVAVLHEIAEASHVSISVDEKNIPVLPAVQGACELLGLDPLHVANEGKIVAVTSPEESGRALAILREHPLGKKAAIIGEVRDRMSHSPVRLRASTGGERVLSLPVGELLPRIC